MVENVFAWLRAALYHFLYGIVVALVPLRTSYLSFKQRGKEGLQEVVGRHPALGRLFAWALEDVRKSHIGANPAHPTSLAVVVAQPLKDGALSQLAMLISWAEQEGFREVFLYDPQGWLQKRRLLLEKELEALGCPLVLHVGWPPAAEGAAADTADPLAAAAVTAAAELRRRRRNGSSGSGGSSCSGSEGGGRGGDAWEQHHPTTLEVVLLSAADAHWPLAKAAAAAAMRGECAPGPAILGSSNVGGAVGPHVLPAAATAAEGVSGAAGSEGEGGAEARLAQAVASPARLRARLQAVAGPLAGSEPELVLVFGEALTLAGYPPWAVRVSEIYRAGMLQQLRKTDLNHLLRRFMATKQRFGT